jgi:hypothetical protein
MNLDDDGGFSLSNTILVVICFPWAVAVLLDQAGLFVPALDTFFALLEAMAKAIGQIVGGL